MAAIVGDHNPCTGTTGDFRDVRVVEAAADDGIARAGAKHRELLGLRQVVHGHPSKHLVLQEERGIGRRDAKFRRELGRDRKKFETAVPGCCRLVDALLRGQVEE